MLRTAECSAGLACNVLPLACKTPCRCGLMHLVHPRALGPDGGGLVHTLPPPGGMLDTPASSPSSPAGPLADAVGWHSYAMGPLAPLFDALCSTLSLPLGGMTGHASLMPPLTSKSSCTDSLMARLCS